MRIARVLEKTKFVSKLPPTVSLSNCNLIEIYIDKLFQVYQLPPVFCFVLFFLVKKEDSMTYIFRYYYTFCRNCRCFKKCSPFNLHTINIQYVQVTLLWALTQNNLCKYTQWVTPYYSKPQQRENFTANAASYVLICQLLRYTDIFKSEESKEDRTCGIGVIGTDSTCQAVSLCPVTVHQSLMKRIWLFLP